MILDCAGPLSVVGQCVQRYITADGVWDAWGERTGPGAAAAGAGAAAGGAAMVTGMVLAAAAVFV